MQLCRIDSIHPSAVVPEVEIVIDVICGSEAVVVYCFRSVIKRNVVTYNGCGNWERLCRRRKPIGCSFYCLQDGAKAYMRNHNVPKEMQQRVQRWYDYAWSRFVPARCSRIGRPCTGCEGSGSVPARCLEGPAVFWKVKKMFYAVWDNGVVNRTEML